MDFLSILSGTSSKLVIDAINQTTSETLTSKVKITSVRIRLDSSVLRHKMEDGSTKVDCRACQPRVIEMDVIVPDSSSLETLNEAFLNREDFFTVRSKGLVFTNYMFDGESLSHTAKNLSSTPVTLKYKEVLTSNFESEANESPGDDGTANRGIAEIGKTLTNTVANVYNAVAGWF